MHTVVRCGLAAAAGCALAVAAGAAVPEKGAHELYLSAGGLAGGALTGAARYGHFFGPGLEFGLGAEGGVVRRSSWISGGPFAEKSFDLGGELSPFVGARVIYGTSLIEARADPDNPEAGVFVPPRRTRGILAGLSAGANYFVAPGAALSAAVQADMPSDEHLRFRAPYYTRVQYVFGTRFFF